MADAAPKMPIPEPGWLAAVIQILPRLRGRIQLAGFVTATAAGLVIAVIAPGNIPALICATGLGVTMIIFGQLFAVLPVIPPDQRAFLVIAMFLIFVGMELGLAVLLGAVLAGGVSIVRTADYTGSSCREGKRRDFATLTDVFKLDGLGNSKVYTATADAFKGQSVRLFDLNVNPELEAPITDRNSTDGNETIFKWNVRIVGDVARVRWEWANAHQASHEGLAFRSAYRINNIDATVRLPPGVQIANFKFAPLIAQANCHQVGENHFLCQDLRTVDLVTIAWDWNIWANCPKELSDG
jgi:hypothetical protein